MYNTDFNRHYIIIRTDNAIIDAWSDGPHPEKDTINAICINEYGSYQLYLVEAVDLYCELPSLRNTEENPVLFTYDGIPIYVYTGRDNIVRRRTNGEIEVERLALPTPSPSLQEQLRADVDFIAAMTGVVL